MKLSLSPVVVAGVTLAVLQQVAASPIRVVVVTSEVSHVRFGHPVEAAPVAELVRPDVVTAATTTEFRPNGGAGRHHHSCGRLRNKAIEISNMFRHVFGMPPVETSTSVSMKVKPEAAEEPDLHILPFVGTPNSPPPHVEAMEPKPDDGRPHHHHHHHGPHHHHHHQPPFFARIHHAIMSLGTWEGGLVAFILGCGIAVLLRMFYVLSVLTFRAVRGSRAESEDEYYYEEIAQPIVIFDGAAEDLVLPPPEYTDEKVALATVDNKDNKSVDDNTPQA
ncbi:hypothetical protein C8Q75DRAFT_883301 [Abortiporus biennis]|nr:hypothetical protein C8Q75DRAFT_883301 [Abortiporus biennis]